MDSLPLLESSLRTCPRFAKAHVEISKIYSGLYKEKFNLTRSRYHLDRAEYIDPDFCDVHQQFAHVAIQEQEYEEFERRLTRALLCPFTMGGSIGLWQNYWKMALDTSANPSNAVISAKKRYESYMAIINEAMANQKARDEDAEALLKAGKEEL
jgi:hypothetical protein